MRPSSPAPPTHTNAALFSTAPRSARAELTGPKQPGPGDYNDVVTNRGMPFKSCRNGKFSSSARVTELDVLQARARLLPGPSVYQKKTNLPTSRNPTHLCPVR